MGESDNFPSISDADKPNAGRIYDYILGGNHNFEIDRMAAQKVLELAPFAPQLFRLIRWFLGEAAVRLSSQGYKYFIDFASGLPTMDHIHQVTPEGTKVIYSDIDPVVVAYAHDIIKDNPYVQYVHCNAGTPEELLESDMPEKLFGSDRNVAVGFNGIAYFLPDDRIAHFMKTLYGWTGDNARLFLCDGDAGQSISEDAKKLTDIYNKLNQPIYPRSKKRMLELIKPWKVDDPGMMLLEDWVDIETKVTEKMKDTWHAQGTYGVILKK
ncbi:MAG: hypothetical protein GXP33_06200 [Spirochaetes bacterium]|nr:hypothetical protein [Spirochaetota bacterium]